MARSNKTQSQLVQMMRRQSTDRFGAEYEPARRAVRGEAPSISNAWTDFSRFIGRDVHSHSEAERRAIHLALFYPGLRDLNEQRILSPVPRAHPFAAHPLMVGRPLPGLRGTLQIAEEMGRLSAHSFISIPNDDGEKIPVPWPYLGDVLLLLVDSDGPYALNWNIKKRPKDFAKPIGGSARFRNPKRAEERARFRDDLEKLYYLDAEVRTVDVAGVAIDDNLAANLRHLLYWQNRPGLNSSQVQDALARHRDGMDRGIPPIEIIRSMCAEIGGERQDHKATLWHLIWEKDLEVDLFKPLLIDRPLEKPRVGVFEIYQSFFTRRG